MEMNTLSKKWTEVTLGEICEFKYGKSLPEARRTGGEVPVYGSNGIVGYHNEAITQGITIVVGRKGSFGEVNLSPVSCWSIDTAYYIDGNSTDADLSWLAYQLVNLRLTELNKSAAVPGLNREDAYRKRLFLPPIAEQKRIAAILDKAEELRSLRRKALAELDAIVQSIFLEMFGESVEKTEDLHIKSLGSHLSFLTSGGRGWAQFYSLKGSRFIRSLDVQVNYISDDDAAYVTPPDNAEAKRTRVERGDVLLTITGSRIGRVAPVPENLAGSFISQHVAILRPNSTVINPIFLSFFLNMSSGGQRQIAKFQYGQTKPGLNFEQINNFKIPVPKIQRQEEFVQRVEAIDRLKATQRESLAQIDALFAALQHRAFQGEL